MASVHMTEYAARLPPSNRNGRLALRAVDNVGAGLAMLKAMLFVDADWLCASTLELGEA